MIIYTVCLAQWSKREYIILYVKNTLTPAGTWRRNDVMLTSMRRKDVALTLIWRHFDVMSPLEHIQKRDIFLNNTERQTISCIPTADYTV